VNNIASLATVSTNQTGTTPLQVNHTGQFPSVTVSFNLAPGVSMSDATREVSEMEQRLGLPSTGRGFFAGTRQAYQQSLSTEPMLIATALLAVYIVLGILYESLIHPLTIISTLPSASVGAMLALMLFHMDLNVISIIGIVLLIGIVKKNAIMMIDFALVAERKEGKSTADAIFRGVHLTFSPHPDDYHGCNLRRTALSFRHGNGIGIAAPVRNHDCRRPASQPIDNAVYDTGGLSDARLRAPANTGQAARHIRSRGGASDTLKCKVATVRAKV
jgi:multidrug efflux pump